ncbi:MAG TPA: hypothetical protein VMB21_13950 [Candidatus Limnocylindria bacterium]|jgi:hypothetical protein|nr:hypothetical protein [Candidatus Limnocylindria bacterium]
MNPTNPRLLTVHEPEETSVWSLWIEAGSDPLLIPRILQKLAVPEIELLGLNLSRGEKVSFVRIHVRSRGALVRLAVAKLRKLVMVHEARLA